MSYGIIAFRNRSQGWNQAMTLASDENSFSGQTLNSVDFLLVQRKDSIGYIELVRGKYKLSDLVYIREQVAGTTQKERDKLLTLSFSQLWSDVWGEENPRYRTDMEQSSQKFKTLCEGIDESGKRVTLKGLIEEIPCVWETPEWGFPKGRRNPGETDLECAVREFSEETGLSKSSFRVFENMEPIRETFFGNNHIQYSHVYYLAWIPTAVEVRMNQQNVVLCQEIGQIGWFSLDEAFAKIRPTNLEKREVLLRASTLLRNLCCLLVGPVISNGVDTGSEEQDTSNRDGSDYHGGSQDGSSSKRTYSQTVTRTTYGFVEDGDG